MNTTTVEVKSIDPAMAAAMLAKNSTNRKVNTRRVHTYANFMRNGEWKLNGESICFDSDGNLLNGQHRLLAVIESDMTVPFVIVSNVDDGSFSTYDTGKKRTAGDVFGIAGVRNPNESASAVLKYMILCDDPAAQIIHTKKQTAIAKEKMLEIYNDSRSLFDSAVDLAYKLNYKLNIYRRSDIAAMIVYLVLEKKHSRAEVEHFLRMLFQYETTTDAPYLAYVRDKIIKAGLSAVSMNPRYKQNLLFKAWNMYASNSEGKIVKIADNECVTLK